MKAIVHRKYGAFDELQYGEAEIPAPKADEVLVKVYASAINAGNMFTVSGKPFISRMWSGLLRPKFLNLGSDLK